MRVLISSTPGYGHVLPMVPLARALQSRGHEVRWATAADACGRLQALGFGVVEAGMTGREFTAGLLELLEDRPSLPPEQLAAFVFPRMFGAVRTPRMLPDLLSATRDWPPDLLIHEQGELAAPLVARLLGVPNVTHAFGGAVPAELVAGAAECTAYLWQDHGLAPPPLGGCFEHLYLDICPTSLQTVRLGHVPRIQALRPTPVSTPDSGPIVVGADDTRPLVYLTLGTVHNSSQVLTGLVAALANLQIRLLVAVGPAVDPTSIGAQPGHVTVAGLVAQAEILPLCAAVVSHGGSGTCLGAAAYGVPQVCLPQGADQFRNAEGLARSGAGLALHPEQATPDAVAQAVRQVLTDTSFRDAAAGLAQEITAMPSPDEVAGVLESLVTGDRVPH